jgi:hypothetical protein
MKRKVPSSPAPRLDKWMRQIGSDEIARTEALPLRRDMVTLLTYIRDNRITGAQNTGNLPLKAVREVTARFVHPPQLDTAIGDRVYKLRSEDDVWSLSFLHTLAFFGGLLDGGPARRWRLTPVGEKFLNMPPPVQLWVLLSTWWEQVDWRIAFPFTGMGESLPARFTQITLDHLRALPINTHVAFVPFADKLIQETQLKWSAPDMSSAQMSLRSAIHRMVIRILADFGAVEPEYQDKPLGTSTIKELVTFQVTSFGKGLLESLEM